MVNDANDTTTGTITAAGFTTAGSLTLGGHAVNDIDLGGEFVDADDHLMTSAQSTTESHLLDIQPPLVT